jgi:hypothetical protein
LSENLIESKTWPPSSARLKLAARKARRYFEGRDKCAPYEDFLWRVRAAPKPISMRGTVSVIPFDINSTRSATPEYVKTINKLIELLELPGGWNSYNAKPISKENVTFAVGLLAQLMHENTPAPQVVPKVRGGVRLEWHTRGINIEIDIDSPNGFSFFAEDLHGRQEPIEEEMDEIVLSQWIDRLSG